ALYPDCPSQRGQRHIRELTNLIRKGGQGLLVFMAALPEVKAFRPNQRADPIFYSLVEKAHALGLGLKAFNLYYDPQDSYLYLVNPELKIMFY
ncbi:MAG: DNA/RNA nuclease SfsA, partial [Candidatus Aminicenantales bacterium]